ncbi:hypothetical protein H7F33_02825 [Pedobacter sp. PAMC26386]|nr:hypothetical protein H7F33_02825 [Pedobacter sp. PAMC26386]
MKNESHHELHQSLQVVNKSIATVSKDTTLTDTIISKIDTTTVLSSFKKTVKTARFIKELEMDQDGGSIFDSERPILIGDINGDHLDDAIMPFSIEGRGGGNNWDTHYAIFINKGGKLEYKYSFSRGGDLAERQIQFMRIKDNLIRGAELPGFKFPEGDSVGVAYIYSKKGLINSK